MVVAANIWNFAVALVLIVPSTICIAFIGYLVHRDSQNETVHMSLPRIIPWSVASKARRVRAEVELARAKQDLHEQKHGTLQKEMILRDLENEQFKRSLESGDK